MRWVVVLPVLGSLLLFGGTTIASRSNTSTSRSRLHLHDQDRRHRINNKNCSKWTPNSQYWDYLPGNLEAFLDEKTAEEVHQVEECFQAVIRASDEKDMSACEEEEEEDENTEERKIGHTFLDSGTGRVILVEIERAIAPHHVELVKELAHCIQLHFLDYFERRSFGEGGGNDVTYLSPLFLSMMLPEVAAVVQSTAELAYTHAHWSEDSNLIPVSHCGLRTSEFLDYSLFRALTKHLDAGSLYTTIFALSQPDRDYQEGYNYFEDSMQVQHFIQAKQYSALVFLSELPHGVTTITEGTRQMFANEYWAFPDPPFLTHRPDNAMMELFERRCEEIDPSRNKACGIEAWPDADVDSARAY